MRVYGGLAPSADVVDRVRPARPTKSTTPASVSPTWAAPVTAARAVMSKPALWSPPVVWPAPDLAVSLLLSMAPQRVTPAGWPAPTLPRSPWPAPVAVSFAAPVVLAPPSPIAHTADVGHGRPTVRRGRSLAYAVAGLAAAVVGFAVIVIR